MFKAARYEEISRESDSIMDASADRLRAWLRQVLEERGWSAEQWARRADIAPTTLTRFIKGTGHWVLSYKTLEKLARAAGVAPPIALTQGAEEGVELTKVRRVPVLTIPKKQPVTKRGLREMAKDARQFVITDGDTKEAYAVQVTVPSYMGVHIGDTVIIEPFDAKRTTEGDLVLVRTESGIGPYAYHPPLLVPRPTVSEIEPVRIGEADIIGRAVQLIRNLTRTLMQAVGLGIGLFNAGLGLMLAFQDASLFI